MSCDHWAQGAYCGVPDTRRYVSGNRCDPHAPAALAGRTVPIPDPDATLEALRAKAGIMFQFRRTDTKLIDDRAIASGRRRSSSADYRQAQKAEHQRRMGEAARRRGIR